jgi:DnaJ-class molecular chaperone
MAHRENKIPYPPNYLKQNPKKIPMTLNKQMKTTCRACNGSGSYLAMGEELCPGCAGTGRDKNSDLWSEPCRQCNGKRRVPYCRKVLCKTCRGTGQVSY